MQVEGMPKASCVDASAGGSTGGRNTPFLCVHGGIIGEVRDVNSLQLPASRRGLAVQGSSLCVLLLMQLLLNGPQLP